MATINGVPTRPSDNTVVVLWETLTTSNASGVPVPSTFDDYCDRSVQITGTFGGTTVTIQGSNDGTNYQTLKNLQGTAISKTSAALEEILENVLTIKPVLTGGDGTTDIDVTIVMRRSRSGR